MFINLWSEVYCKFNQLLSSLQNADFFKIQHIYNGVKMIAIMKANTLDIQIKGYARIQVYLQKTQMSNVETEKD